MLTFRRTRVQFGMRQLLGAIGLACAGSGILFYGWTRIDGGLIAWLIGWAIRLGVSGGCFGASVGILIGRPIRWAVIGLLVMPPAVLAIMMVIAHLVWSNGFHPGS